MSWPQRRHGARNRAPEQSGLLRTRSWRSSSHRCVCVRTRVGVRVCLPVCGRARVRDSVCVEAYVRV